MTTSTTIPTAGPDACPACEGPWDPEGYCEADCQVSVSSDPCQPVWMPVHVSGLYLPDVERVRAALRALSAEDAASLRAACDTVIRLSLGVLR
jgi:hypothetical protein